MEQKIAVVTDSTCDLPAEVIERFGIRVLPLRVIYHDREYADPSGLSGTYGMVKMMSEQINNLKIEVIDSKALSLALGWLVQEAARLVGSGLHFEDIVQKIHSAQAKIKVFFVLKTLEYLKKGGRIGLVEATLGAIFDFKPIISINSEGKYFSLCKVRGRKKSIDKIAEIVQGLMTGKRFRIAVMHGNAFDEAKQLLERLLKMSDFQIEEVFFGQIGPAMVVHTGPGLLGVAVQEL
ncbi:MAG: DegV family protein [Firmicutes bacterium]|nr:DegV family protein [Bacillota bacterium]